MKISKSDLFDILAFDNEQLKANNPKLHELKYKLIREISERITEDNHIEINFVENE
jgi:hypothetical protein